MNFDNQVIDWRDDILSKVNFGNTADSVSIINYYYTSIIKNSDLFI